MARTELALGALALALTAAACGGRQMLDLPPDTAGAAGTSGSMTMLSMGPVDFSQAPSEIPASCDGAFGAVAFQNPCLVGQNLNGLGQNPAGQSPIGVHAVECHVDVAGTPVAWSFLLVLSTVSAASPTVSGPFPPVPTGGLVTIAGVTARVTAMTGTFTFSQLDPKNRSFVARFQGSIVWTELSGQTFACTIDAPFWGAPGSFA